MEEVGQQGQDRDSSTSISSLPFNGGDGLERDNHNRIDKPLSPKNESIISNQPDPMNPSRTRTPVNPFNVYNPPEQTYFYGGFDDGSVNWGENSNYVHANNLQIMSPAIYNDNTSLFFHPGYAIDTQFSPIMIDGQLYSPHQVPLSPSYYSPAVSPADFAAPASSGQEGYYYHYPGSNNLGFYKFSSDVGPSESGSNQSTPVGILGPYEQSFGQQQTPYHGYGFLSGSSTRRYPSHPNRLVLDQDNKHTNRGSANLANDSLATTSDRNRGPRGSKPKGTNTSEPIDDLSSRAHINVYNRPDFITTHENAKFFVIKSFSEDNVHRSIKYGVWASTPLGNRKLDAAYQEAKKDGATSRIFLFFSVNASGQFCGVAEMVGPMDFENDVDYWQQDRWSGQFRVEWHIIKDVPNSCFRHIILENNDNKPVAHSRDSQEVKLEEGIEMLKIFKEYDAETSILDDFDYYDEREKSWQEKRVKNASSGIDGASITQLSDRIKSIELEKHKEVK